MATAPYVINPDDPTQPTENLTMGAAAAELRGLKQRVLLAREETADLETRALTHEGANPYELDAQLNANGNKITELPTATEASDAAPLSQVLAIVGAASSGIIASVRQKWTATEGQTAFVLTLFTYVPTANNLAVYVNGLRQDVGTSYIETNSTTFTFTSGLTAGDVVQAFSNESVNADAVALLRDDLNSPASGKGSEIIVFKPAGVGAAARKVSDKLHEFVTVTDFMSPADRTANYLAPGSVDVTYAIQAAIDHAESLVSAAVDGVGDKVNGCTVVMRGVFRITEPLRISADNVCLEGQGGTTIYPYFTSMAGYNGAKPAIIVGTAEQWQLSGLISNTCKYNRITGINIKCVNGYNSFIGVLVSGTRNAVVSNCLFERAFCGLYLENTSEFYSEQVSVIGSTYGVICDNRGQRIAANSVLNVANDDNDVSSNKLDQLTVYYAQHTGLLAINTGTTVVDGMTMGLFSDNPSGSSPALGLPAAYAGVHVWGGANTKWARGLLVDNAVFEAKDNASRDCIRLESSTANNPILGCTFNNVHVQTFAADYVGNKVTTFIKAVQSGNGKIANIVVRDSGFTFQSAGYYYGRMCDISGLAVVAFDNCYPNVAFSTASVGYYGSLRNVNYLDRVPLDAFPPTGWAAEGVTAGCSKQGGSDGALSFLRFTGDAGQILMYRQYTYREYTPELGAAFVSFLARGDAGLSCYARVNGETSTDSSIKSPENEARYSNAFIDHSLIDANTWKRIVFAFNPFAANFEFDRVLFVLGKKPSATSAEKVEIADIKVGYFVGGLVPYNPF